LRNASAARQFGIFDIFFAFSLCPDTTGELQSLLTQLTALRLLNGFRGKITMQGTRKNKKSMKKGREEEKGICS